MFANARVIAWISQCQRAHRVFFHLYNERSHLNHRGKQFNPISTLPFPLSLGVHICDAHVFIPRPAILYTRDIQGQYPFRNSK